jgi:hypothetical protein
MAGTDSDQRDCGYDEDGENDEGPNRRNAVGHPLAVRFPSA